MQRVRKDPNKRGPLLRARLALLTPGNEHLDAREIAALIHVGVHCVRRQRRLMQYQGHINKKHKQEIVRRPCPRNQRIMFR